MSLAEHDNGAAPHRADEQVLDAQGDWTTPVRRRAEFRQAAAAHVRAQFVTTWHEVNSYIPQSVKSSIAASLPGAGGAPSAPKSKDLVLSAAFDTLDVGGRPHLCLVLCYDNGFQVWDLDDPAHVVELLSKRDVPIKSVVALRPPLAPEIAGCPLYGRRPVLAVASASEASSKSAFPNNVVQLFSVPAHAYINQLRFKSRVLSLASTRRVFVVALANHVYAFDSTRLSRVLSLATFPSPTPTHAVLAVGTRWMAYASDEPLPRGAEPESTALDRVVDTAGSAAADVGRSLVDFGKKTFSSYWYGADSNGGGGVGGAGDDGGLSAATLGAPGAAGGDQQLQVTTAEQDARAGAVKIVDLLRLRTLAHFRAHWQALAALAFDASGTLLVTAAVDGQTFNVYSLQPASMVAQSSTAFADNGPAARGRRDGGSSSKEAGGGGGGGGSGGGDDDGERGAGSVEKLVHRQLYRLVRGITSAAIQSISFSGDAHYLAVSSSRGTTHVYALWPSGGDVTLSTHAPNAAYALRVRGGLRVDDPDGDWYRATEPLKKLNALTRIKTYANVAAAHGGEVMRVPAIATASLFADAAEALAGGAPGPHCRYATPRHGSDARQIFVVSQLGVVTRYKLLPHAHTTPAERAAAPNDLLLDALPQSAWDACRRVRWHETRFSLRDQHMLHPVSENPEVAKTKEKRQQEKQEAEQAAQKKKQEAASKRPDRSSSQWLANVEIETHSPALRPLWRGPQCSVKTFTLEQDARKVRDEAARRIASSRAAAARSAISRQRSPMKKKKKNRRKQQRGDGDAVEHEGRALVRQSSLTLVSAEEIGVVLHVDERTPCAPVRRRIGESRDGRDEHYSVDAGGLLHDASGELEPLGFPAPANSGAPSAPPSGGGGRAVASSPSLLEVSAIGRRGESAGDAAPGSGGDGGARKGGGAPQVARLIARGERAESDEAAVERVGALVREAMTVPLSSSNFKTVGSTSDLHTLEAVDAAASRSHRGHKSDDDDDNGGALAPHLQPLAGEMSDSAGSSSSSSSADDAVFGEDAPAPINLFDAQSYHPRPPSVPSSKPPSKATSSSSSSAAKPSGVIQLAAANMRYSEDGSDLPPRPSNRAAVEGASSSSAAAVAGASPRSGGATSSSAAASQSSWSQVASRAHNKSMQKTSPPKPLPAVPVGASESDDASD